MGTLVSVGYHCFLAYVLHRGYPWSTFLFRPNSRFSDFLTDYATVRSYGSAVPYQLHQFVGYYHAVAPPHTLVYSPFAHLAMRLLAFLPPVEAFALELGVFVMTVVFCIAYYTRTAAPPLRRVAIVLILAGASYPVLFAIDRGNMEMLVFVALFWFLWFYDRRKFGAAALLLATAISLKYYAAVFLLLPLSDRRIREAVYTVLLSAAQTVTAVLAVGLMTFGVSPWQVLRDTWSTLVGVQGSYTTWGFEGITYRHSLWNLVHLGWIGIAGRDPSGRVVLMYMAFAIAVLAAIAVWLVVRSGSDGTGLALWQKTSVIVVCLLVLPPLSGDYTLLTVYLPLMLILAKGYRSRACLLPAVFFSLCLVPMDWLVIEGTVRAGSHIYPSLGDTKTSVVIYPIFLIGALASVLIYSRRIPVRETVHASAAELETPGAPL